MVVFSVFLYKIMYLSDYAGAISEMLLDNLCSYVGRYTGVFCVYDTDYLVNAGPALQQIYQ